MADHGAEMKRQEEMLKKKYGRVPKKGKKGPLGHLGGERKFFDSADYAKGGNKATGKEHATVDKVHAPKQHAQRGSLNHEAVAAAADGAARPAGGDGAAGAAPPVGAA
eukprot:CAMPEP_0182916328 /NCGR_PEP_ID=MMETSP0105_2-20130417/871_1 /TAXON_ID=81532 ORGANISM="Acanthoeca-like sp., Strain 10tr" /NCGR_SAMPLE_ID=MMETSP0105_2 /ASSEMBLY_ACC=CAM_ASM_000205 /LENGTH=107 /DNA_ID=CAMNT_0025053269 /DNA_START=127 /DNA_END=446 /DNA_ORIENTATION=-